MTTTNRRVQAQTCARIHRPLGSRATALAFLLGAIPLQAAAATFTVTSVADSGTGTLRDAITQANATTGPHTIAFSITGIAAGTPAVIQLTSALPPLTKAVTIDGTTQPDTHTGDITGGQILGVGADGIPGSGDEPTLAPIPRPDVVMEYRGGATPAVLTVAAPDVVLKGLGLRMGNATANVNGIVVSAGASVNMELMWIGASQGATTDLTDSANRFAIGVLISGGAGQWRFARSVMVNTNLFGVNSVGVTRPGTVQDSYFGPAGWTAGWNAEPMSLLGATGGRHQIVGNYINNTEQAGGLDLNGASAAARTAERSGTT